MVAEGMAEALAAHLRDAPHPQGAYLLGQAYANQARGTTDAAQQQEAYENARRAYQRWIAQLDARAATGDLAARVAPALVRIELASILLSGYAAEPLGALDLSAGHLGDRALVRSLLDEVRQLCAQAESTLQPLLTDLPRFEEHLLAAGIYDALLAARVDLMLQQGWAAYFSARYKDVKPPERNQLLSAAERIFRQLLELKAAERLHPHVRMALGMTQRELQRYGEGARSLQQALSQAEAAPLVAQIRCELARCHLAAHRFDEARTNLAPLTQKDPTRLPAADEAVRFYVRQAHLLDANSYLIEAEVVRQAALRSPVREAIAARAREARITGLRKMKALADLGPPWPSLVRVFVARSVDPEAPVDKLLPIELLYTAQARMDAQRWDAALVRLERAAAIPGIESDVLGDVLFELGRCQYQLGQPRAAAATFDRLASQLRSHARAPQAATVAYQLWGQIAEASGQQADYQQLANTLRNLITSFADHPRRGEATWLLPVALQLAGEYQRAADAFALVPKKSEHWEEAQFRRVICAQQACAAAQDAMDSATFAARARQTAQMLQEYAAQALQRVAISPQPEQLRSWAGRARLAAAELLCTPGVEGYTRALQMLDGFEETFPRGVQRGRVLAVRMRAYHGMREFARAAQMLQSFLDSAAPETVRPTLTALGAGMQREVARLTAAGQQAEAQALAVDALTIFDALEERLQSDGAAGADLLMVRRERAELLHVAGQHAAARALVEQLLQQRPRDGTLRRLHAQVLTAALDARASEDDLRTAQQAWEAILADAGLRQRTPDRYWEARYHWLSLHLRRGHGDEVARAIFQESRWLPNLGGSPWRERLTQLYRDAGGRERLERSDAGPTTSRGPDRGH
jgi:tetratricopeptide (TPR) repeat protein